MTDRYAKNKTARGGRLQHYYMLSQQYTSTNQPINQPTVPSIFEDNDDCFSTTDNDDRYATTAVKKNDSTATRTTRLATPTINNHRCYLLNSNSVFQNDYHNWCSLMTMTTMIEQDHNRCGWYATSKTRQELTIATNQPTNQQKTIVRVYVYLNFFYSLYVWPTDSTPVSVK